MNVTDGWTPRDGIGSACIALCDKNCKNGTVVTVKRSLSCTVSTHLDCRKMHFAVHSVFAYCITKYLFTLSIFAVLCKHVLAYKNNPLRYVLLKSLRCDYDMIRSGIRAVSIW